MAPFPELVSDFLAETLRLEPTLATAVGKHDHDARWPDLSAAGRAATLASIERWSSVFGQVDPASLTTDEAIDRDRILGVLASERYGLVEARNDAWDPLWWIYVMGGGLFPLLAREFAPAAIRLDAFAGRLEGVPTLVDAAREALGSVEDRPVSRLHTERALEDLAGIPALIDDALALADHPEAGPATADLRTRLESAAAGARAALAGFEAFLRDVILPGAIGEGRLGRERYAAALALTLGDPGMTIEHVLAAAERQFPAVRAEMARVARLMWPDVRPGEPPPDDEDSLIRAAMDRVAADHTEPDELLRACRDALVRIEAFCRRADLIGLVDEPLEIAWTPIFLRGWAQAMLTSPGPFEAGQKAIFHITPIPASWSDQLRESYLREMNRRQLEVLTIHEAVPGHYLEGAYTNRAGSTLRAVFGDGAFVEGWAVYVTQVMIDAGYAGDDLGLVLAHWKYYLRAVVNAILDIRVHVFDMTEEEALDLMIRGGFQEEAEARAKYSRARLTSTQLSTYFVGSLGLWELEHEVRRRAAAGSGDPRGADAVPVPSIVGGYPATPGFDYRAHLESVIGHGQLPLPLLRRAILG